MFQTGITLSVINESVHKVKFVLLCQKEENVGPLIRMSQMTKSTLSVCYSAQCSNIPFSILHIRRKQTLMRQTQCAKPKQMPIAGMERIQL